VRRRRSNHVLSLAKQRQQQVPPYVMAELAGVVVGGKPNGVDQGI